MGSSSHPEENELFSSCNHISEEENASSSCNTWNFIASVLDPEYVPPEDPKSNGKPNIIKKRLSKMERDQLMDDLRQEGAPKSLEMQAGTQVASQETSPPPTVMELGDMLVVRPNNSQESPKRDSNKKRGLRGMLKLRSLSLRKRGYE